MRRQLAGGLIAALMSAPLAGCGGPAAAGDPAAARTLTVLAAASLTESFTAVAQQVEAGHPGLSVRLSFDASSTLARQVAEGAPADVLATASKSTMGIAVDAGAVDEPRRFARNRLVLAVPAGNPAGVSSLQDLADPDLTVGLCEPAVPCGEVATALLAAAGAAARPDTREPDVKVLLAKLRLGEVDAALVYRTDVRAAADDVDEVPTPAVAAGLTDYYVATVTDAREPEAADWFVEALAGTPGSRALSAAGFDLP